MKISASPGICFDTETTGISPTEDRVVEVGAVRHIPAACLPDAPAGMSSGRWVPVFQRVNPGRPIPAEATAIHRISDADVADKPPFNLELAGRLEKMFQKDGWIGGYNAARYDAPLLNAEFERAGSAFRIDPARVLDGYIFVSWHMRGSQGRKLADVCGQLDIRLSNAHTTADDSEAALRVILALVAKGYIPDDLEAALAEQARIGKILDEEFARWTFMLYNHRKTGEVCVGFGKHCGKPLSQVPKDYLSFILGKFDNVPPEAATLMRKAAGLG